MKEIKCEAAGKQIEQDLEPANGVKKELQSKELNKNAEYSRLLKRSQVLHDMTILA